ncbi:MAG: sugar transferase [Eubacteriales bacterium]|nr:sugar transferase [Eubacteriales bacterium]
MYKIQTIGVLRREEIVGEGMYRRKKQIIELAVCLLDLVAVLCSLLIAGLIRYESFERLARRENLVSLFSVVIILHIAVFYVLKSYDDFYRRNYKAEFIFSVKFNFILVILSVFLGFSMKNEVFTSRLVMGYFFVLNTIFMWIVNQTVKYVNRKLRKENNLLIVTTSDRINEILDRFGNSKEVHWNIPGILLLGETDRQNSIRGIPVIPDVPDACLEYATLHVVDEVFIHVDEIQTRENYLKTLILEFEKMGVVVNLSLDLFELDKRGDKQVYKLEEYSVIAFSSRLFDYRMVVLKRLIDIAGAIVGLILTIMIGIILAPFLLIESPGPLVFCQNRVGVNGRIFKFYKFRSMYADAEERKKELMAQNEMSGLMFKMENDPRITKIGAFIRKTSIDELPQFWNVLKGDMSLVGTRPPTVDEYQQYSYYQKRRISFRPGITGLWQVSGRSDITDFDEIVKLDLEYIDNWSILEDFKIIFKTIAVVFRGSGAR